MARVLLITLIVIASSAASYAGVLKGRPTSSGLDPRLREYLVEEIRRQQELLELTAEHLGEDAEEYAFRRLLEKFVYALNIRTIVAAMRDTLTGEITPADIIAKTHEVLGEASSLATGIIQLVKNMAPTTFKIFMDRILNGDNA
ncbi:uncharacterized protein LOC144151434 [Haemaphysalis longicornis]